MQQLFWQSQSNSKRTSDWGLRLKLTEKIVGSGLITEHGFVDSKWPSQKVRTDISAGNDSRMYQKTTTYVHNGRLIQVVAIVCDDNSDISWEIGGEVQMWSEPSMLPTTHSNMHYAVNVTDLQSGGKTIPVLTVEGECHFKVDNEEFVQEIMCMDVAVFLNREPQNLGHVATTATQQSANFTRDCSECLITLTPRKGLCFVAVFFLRDKSQELKAETMSCPSWSDLWGRLGIKKFGEAKIHPTGSSLPNLKAALVEITGISQLAAMPDIITRTVEQLCSIAIRFKVEADDSIYSDYDALSSAESAQTADGPGQAAGIHDRKTGNQSVVTIVNNLAIGPVRGQLIQEPYL